MFSYQQKGNWDEERCDKPHKNFWINGGIRSSGFLCIFKVTFFLLLAPAEGSNPVGH